MKMTPFICSSLLQNSPIWLCPLILLLLRLLFGYEEVCDTILKAISNASACKRACHKAYHRIHAQVRKVWEQDTLTVAPSCDGCSEASVDSVDDDRGLCSEVQEVDEPSLLDGEQGSTDARQDSLGEHLFLSMWLVLLAF
mmetsp:Transcript_63956/g.101785  ORF Transcript_63956/g.101785 Transcript_63956/m.101785 type:complete len:140 (-) Transcript_63956:161-580(-)